MKIIYSKDDSTSKAPGALLTVLLDDYDIVHNKYLENRANMGLEKYEEDPSWHHAAKVIDFLGSNKTQIKKNVIDANMETNWVKILDRVLDMHDNEIAKLTPPRNHAEKRRQFSFICTKRPFVALFEKIVAHEDQQLYLKSLEHETENSKYKIQDYLAAF